MSPLTQGLNYRSACDTRIHSFIHSFIQSISREIIFQEFQPTVYSHDTSTLQPDWRTYGQLALAIPGYATLRAVKTIVHLLHLIIPNISVISIVSVRRMCISFDNISANYATSIRRCGIPSQVVFLQKRIWKPQDRLLDWLEHYIFILEQSHVTLSG